MKVKFYSLNQPKHVLATDMENFEMAEVIESYGSYLKAEKGDLILRFGMDGNGGWYNFNTNGLWNNLDYAKKVKVRILNSITIQEN